ncbi:hypothetical protein [Variovorax paradoxus]
MRRAFNGRNIDDIVPQFRPTRRRIYQIVGSAKR